MKNVLLLLLLTQLGVGVQAQPTSQTLVAPGAIWKFFAPNQSVEFDLGTAWRAEAFSDAAWVSGPSPLGYSPGNTDGASTTVCTGCTDCAENCQTKRITTYFRYHLNLSDASGTYAIRYQRDDGIVIYVNGTEVHRENLPASPATITYSTTATAVPSDPDELLWITVPTVSSSLFHTGNNVIAVEIHQTSETSSDIRFNMEVVRTGGTGAALTRGPYLQMGTPTEMTLRWRSSSANTGRVRYWTTSPGSQTINADESTATTEHEKRLTGLAASTRYNYTIGGTDGTILQSTADNYFYTAPLTGTTKKTRIWALGDFGKGPGTPRQANVKNQFLNYVGGNYIDMWLWLGDNAYNENGIGDGSQLEYQTKVFDIYGPDRIMRQTPIYATPGNHDYASNGANHAIPYFDILSNFTNAEGGGVASGKEEYYSFNHGNIHVVSLDSYGHEPGQGTSIFASTGPQITWLKSDLAAAKANPAIVWVIVFAHHPPYTIGTHNSDTESDLTNIRQQLVPVLDQYKVDMLITGHDHVYERSKLMKNYLTLETDFNPAVHNAPPANNEPTPNYYYKSQQASVNEGIMYIVNGAGGANGFTGTPTGYPHNAMDFSINQGGSLYLEIDGAQLDGKFIGDDGLIKDQFTMIKTDPPGTNTLYGTSAGANLPTTSGQNTLLGYQAGNSTTSSDNTFVGYRAGHANTSGTFNSFVGVQAGLSNTTGSSNVFTGLDAGRFNTTGSNNLFAGYQAGYTNSSGGNNTFLGFRAGYTNTTGAANVFLGSQAGLSNTTGTGNLFLGQQAGINNSTASYNLFMGNGSGSNTTTGGGNTAIGDGAMLSNTTGQNNTSIGRYAGINNTTGFNNTFIGVAASAPAGSGALSNATAIGYNASVTASNALILGNGVNVGIGNTAPNNKLEITQGSAGNSGLRFTNLTSASPATALNQTKFLSVNGAGDVILASSNGSARVGAENWTLAGESLQNTNAGGVIIGQGVQKTPAGYKLFVEEGILTEKVKVAVRNTSEWSDKVFAPGYRLAPLGEVAQYIQHHQHLPGVASAEEVVKQGMDVAKMNAKLLEKIEELTLYLIEQKKDYQHQLNQQAARIRQLEKDRVRKSIK